MGVIQLACGCQEQFAAKWKTLFSCLRNAAVKHSEGAVKRNEVKYLAATDQVKLEEFEVKLEDQIKPATFKQIKDEMAALFCHSFQRKVPHAKHTIHLCATDFDGSFNSSIAECFQHFLAASITTSSPFLAICFVWPLFLALFPSTAVSLASETLALTNN